MNYDVINSLADVLLAGAVVLLIFRVNAFLDALIDESDYEEEEQ